MYALAALFIAMALIAGAETFNLRQLQVVPVASANALAVNMAEYRQAVIEYVVTLHPGFQGTIPDDDLAGITAYAPNGHWCNYVQGDTVVIYAKVKPAVPIDGEMAKLARGSVFAGVALDGEVVPPGDASVAIALPAGIAAAIPDGSPVWLAQVYPD